MSASRSCVGSIGVLEWLFFLGDIMGGGGAIFTGAVTYMERFKGRDGEITSEIVILILS